LLYSVTSLSGTCMLQIGLLFQEMVAKLPQNHAVCQLHVRYKTSDYTCYILQKIVSISPGICFNMYENKLLKAAFTLAYCGLFRVGEITLSNKKNINNILSNNDVTLSTLPNTEIW
jgi:hypothetical protein